MPHKRHCAHSPSPPSPFPQSSPFPLYDDVLQCVAEFLPQSDLVRFSNVNKNFYRVSKRCSHLPCFIIRSQQTAQHAERQKKLQMVMINSVQDIQHHFSNFPTYVGLGHFCSLNSINTFRGMTFQSRDITYPRVKILSIEEARINIDWGVFPNLEELYVRSSQYDLNMQTLFKCTKLKKVILHIRVPIQIQLYNDVRSFVRTRGREGDLKLCAFFSPFRSFISTKSGMFVYPNRTNYPFVIQDLFNTHHRIPMMMISEAIRV